MTNKTNIIKNSKAILFDLDGTIYLEDELIGDVKNTLKTLRENGKQIVYLTNNSSKTDDEYLEKLSRLGIYEKQDIFYSSLDASIDYIKENFKDAKVYPLCTEKVKVYLVKSGINLSEEGDTLLACFDKELTYEKIVKANNLIVKGARYIATHPDLVCPAKDVAIPDLGSFIEMFYLSSGRRPDVIVGKPYPQIAKGIMNKLSLKPQEITMVGDRLNTDMAFGINANLNTVLVYSGEATKESYAKSGLTVSLTVKDVNELVKYLY